MTAQCADLTMPAPRRTMRRVLAAFAMVVSFLTPLAVSVQPAAAMTTTESTWAYAVLHLMNYERSLHHLPALSMNSHLLYSSHRHDLKMAYYNEMSHQLPGEPWLGTRVTNAGYIWTYVGENIGWNSTISKSGVLQLETIMYNEKYPYDGHRQNILSSHYVSVGIDVHLDSIHHKVWLTEDFARH